MNPARYTLDNEDFIPSQLQTTLSPMHSDRLRALLYSFALTLLLLAFLPPKPWIIFPKYENIILTFLDLCYFYIFLCHFQIIHRFY